MAKTNGYRCDYCGTEKVMESPYAEILITQFLGGKTKKMQEKDMCNDCYAKYLGFRSGNN